MQGPYEDLRRLAAAKRDKIIQAARAEYQAALQRIKALHALVENDDRPAIGQPIRYRQRTLTDMLKDALPKDRAVTIAEVSALLFEDPEACKYKPNYIRGQFRALHIAGFIRQTGRRNGHVLWVR